MAPQGNFFYIIFQPLGDFGGIMAMGLGSTFIQMTMITLDITIIVKCLDLYMLNQMLKLNDIFLFRFIVLFVLMIGSISFVTRYILGDFCTNIYIIDFTGNPAQPQYKTTGFWALLL